MKFNTTKIKLEELLSVILILVSLVLLIYSTECGLGLTNDSKFYLKGGHVLSEKGHFMDIDYPKNIVPNGPLLPLILSFLGNNPTALYRVLSIVFFWVTLVSFKFLIFNLVSNKFFKIWTLSALCFGIPIFMVYNFLWTESAFITILSIALIYVYRYVSTVEEKYLVVIGIISFFLTALRMAGVIFPLSIFFILFILNKGLLKRPLFIISLLLSVSGFVLWRIYLLTYDGGLEKVIPPEEVIHLYRFQVDYLSSLGLWFLPNFVNDNLRAIFSGVLILGASLILYMKKEDLKNQVLAYTKILVGCAVIYYVGRSILERDLDEIDRYLSEIYPLSIIALGIIADVLVKNLTKVKRVLVMALLFLWLLYPIFRTFKNVIFWNEKFCKEHTGILLSCRFSSSFLIEY